MVRSFHSVEVGIVKGSRKWEDKQSRVQKLPKEKRLNSYNLLTMIVTVRVTVRTFIFSPPNIDLVEYFVYPANFSSVPTQHHK